MMPGLWEVISASMNLGAEKKKGFCKPVVSGNSDARGHNRYYSTKICSRPVDCLRRLPVDNVPPTDSLEQCSLQVLLPDPPEAFVASGFLVDQEARHENSHSCFSGEVQRLKVRGN